MRRGTRVGQAYVAVTADGSGINEEIVDAVDESGKDIDDKGREHGDKYGEGFSDGFLDRMRNKVGRRLGSIMDGTRVGGKAGDEAGDSFVDRMSDKVRGMGDRISEELSDRIASKPEAVRRGVDRAFSDEFADRVGQRFANQFISTLEARIADGDSRIGVAVNKMMDKSVSGNGAGGSKGGGVGDIIGRLLGKGSRNNALNLLGSTMGTVVGLTEKAGKFAMGFADGMAGAAQGASLVARFIAGLAGGAKVSGLAGMFSRLAVSGPLLVAALGAVLFAASALVSVMGALLGIMVAIASTIASALVGALAVAAPLLGALAVAGGLVTAAFTSMTEAQREYLSSAFQPVKAAFTGIGQIIFTEFTKPLYDGQSAIQVWSSNIQRALVPLAGVAKATAGAFAQAGNTLTASLSGAGFTKFFDSLSANLPGIITNLSSAFAGFGNGVAAVFAAIMPQVLRFSDYLDRVATNFSEWANSASGQNSIKDFVDRALDSLVSLWDFLGELGGLIADVLFSEPAQGAGNSIFDNLAEALKRVRRAINDGSLEEWFEDAIEFGRDLWHAINKVSGVIQSLYDDGTLTAVGNMIRKMGDAFEWVDENVAPVIGAIKDGLADALEDVISPIQAAIDMFQSLWNAIDRIADAADRATEKLAGLRNQDNLPSAPAAPTQPWQDPPETGVGPQARAALPGVMARMNGAVNNWLRGGKNPDLQDLVDSGNEALNNTLEENGGYMQPSGSGKGGKGGSSGSGKDGKKGGKKRPATFEAGWVNPFTAMIEAMQAANDRAIDDIIESIREGREAIGVAMDEAMKDLSDLTKGVYKTFMDGIADASVSTDSGSVLSGLQNMIDQAFASAESSVENAQQQAAAIVSGAQNSRSQMIGAAQAAYDSALSAVGSAKGKKAMKQALLNLEVARADLDRAYAEGDALVIEAERNAQNLINSAGASAQAVAAANATLEAQKRADQNIIGYLVRGIPQEGATLTEFAEARSQVAEKLNVANQNLINAMQVRDQYFNAVSDSIRQFGALTTTQAKVINGVTQALTADDVTTNLRDRLANVREYQNNLRSLLAQGLNQDAYKQLVDAGVDAGGDIAKAILEGGQGSISEVNNLTDLLGAEGDRLGEAASSHLYQAGVDAAQGLVDGLTSLSGELESAAAHLGYTIAQQIRQTLGIASPSRVLIADMEHVGDGAVIGLDNQQEKMAAAAKRLAGVISITPEVAMSEAQVRRDAALAAEVSGNSGRDVDIDVTIVTPTADPHAVATEVLNELVEQI